MASKMELNSLLNTSGADGRLPPISEQRSGTDGDAMEFTRTLPRRPNEAHSRPMHRSRTPWDGNGYSLSVAQNTAGTSSGMADTHESFPSQRLPLPCSSSPEGTWPRHKGSDSRDSRSSNSSAFTMASESSTAHSRYSSLSAVSENQLSIDCRNIEAQIDETCRAAHQQLNQIRTQKSMHRKQNSDGHRHRQQQNMPRRHLYGTAASPPGRTHARHSESSLTGRLMQANMQRSQYGLGTGHGLPVTHAPRHNPAAASHQRAASAPDYHWNSVSPLSQHSDLHTPSQHSDVHTPSQNSDWPMDDSPNPASPDANYPSPGANHPSPGHESHPSNSSTASNDEQPDLDFSAFDYRAPPVCLFRKDCQTGSTLRKAISHIFGRNKLCTRMIPSGVWVYYCRKHYQRTRYRNGEGYPCLQIDLVRLQIERVQFWSNDNAKAAHGPILKDWTLSVRKREQARLDRLAARKKRSFSNQDAEDDFDDFLDSPPHNDTSKVAPIPDWMIPLLGSKYTTSQMLGLVEGLRRDLKAGRLGQVPDVEILPNIVDESLDAKYKLSSGGTNSKKIHKRRTASTNSARLGHRRAQSGSISAMRSDSRVGAHRSSQSSSFHMPASLMHPTTYTERQYQGTPTEKRQRTESNSSDYEQNTRGYSGLYTGNRSMGSIPAPAPSGPSGPSGPSAPSGHSGYGILPAPNPQRIGGVPIVQRLEEAWPNPNSDSQGNRGSWTHQRSQSEAGYPRHHGVHRPTASIAHTGFGSGELGPRDAERTHDALHTHHTHRPHRPQEPPVSAGLGAGSGRSEYDSDRVRLPPLLNVPAMHENPPAHWRGLPLIQRTSDRSP